MKKTIQQELQELELHLTLYPEMTTELALAHFEDYLVLISEYERLKDFMTNKASVKPEFVDASLTIEQKFRVERLKRYLLQHPEESVTYAYIYFHNFLILTKQYQQLEHKANLLQAKPSLPYFL